MYNVDFGVYGYFVTSFEQASLVSVQRPPLMLYVKESAGSLRIKLTLVPETTMLDA